MEPLSILSELKKFSVAEKILIVEELWDSIATDQASVEITAEQREELDRRIADYHASPDDNYTWDEVKKRIRAMK